MTNAKGIRSFIVKSFHGEMLLVSLHKMLDTIEIEIGLLFIVSMLPGSGTPLSLARHNSQISFPATLDETRNQPVIVIF